MKKKSVYNLLLEQSEIQGLPKNFRTDLTKHDRKLLASDRAPKWFGWILYPDGTHLIPGDATLATFRAFVEHAVTDLGNPCIFYIFDGKTLQKFPTTAEWFEMVEEIKRREEDFRLTYRRLVSGRFDAIVSQCDQDALGISRRDGETVEEALQRAEENSHENT